MTDIMKLADDYAQWSATSFSKENATASRAALQSAIEALQGENERMKDLELTWRICHERTSDAAHDLANDRDALQAKLDALQTQEPVATVNEVHEVNCYGYRAINAHAGSNSTLKHGDHLYAAPKAPTPEQVEEAWRAGWAACRDAEYVGQEAEDNAWGMSETCANADWESAAPKALEPLTDEQIDAIMPQPSEFGMHQPPWSGSDLKILRAMSRATEAAHGITKGTP